MSKLSQTFFFADPLHHQ